MEKLKNFIFQKIGLILVLFVSIYLIITNVKIHLMIGIILELIILFSFLFKIKTEYENYKDTRVSWNYVVLSFTTIILVIIKLN